MRPDPRSGRRPWLLAPLLLGLLASLAPTAEARRKPSEVRVDCDESSLRAAIARANRRKGGIIRFDCRDTTIPMSHGLGEIRNRVVIDGEDRNLTLEYRTDFTDCGGPDNEIGGPAIARMIGKGSVIRNLRFKHFLESIQIHGPRNTVEDSEFLGHRCADDAISIVNVFAVDTLIRRNLIRDYGDKAIQMSNGGGIIEGNTFLDTMASIRGPYDNSRGEAFHIRDNEFLATGDRDTCAGVTIDGTYVIHFENNRVECKRGLRLSGGTRAVVRGNHIEGNERVGIRVGGAAVALIAGNTIVGNALAPATLPSGGVVIWEHGEAHLGGGSVKIDGRTYESTGGNCLAGNGVADVRNLREGYRVRAERNCWGTSGSEIVRSRVAGDVTFEPIAECPAECSAPDPVAPPSGPAHGP